MLLSLTEVNENILQIITIFQAFTGSSYQKCTMANYLPFKALGGSNVATNMTADFKIFIVAEPEIYFLKCGHSFHTFND